MTLRPQRKSAVEFRSSRRRYARKYRELLAEDSAKISDELSAARIMNQRLTRSREISQADSLGSQDRDQSVDRW